MYPKRERTVHPAFAPQQPIPVDYALVHMTITAQTAEKLLAVEIVFMFVECLSKAYEYGSTCNRCRSFGNNIAGVQQNNELILTYPP